MAHALLTRIVTTITAGALVFGTGAATLDVIVGGGDSVSIAAGSNPWD